MKQKIVTWASEIKDASIIIIDECKLIFNDLKEIVKNAQVNENQLPKSNTSVK